MFNSKAFLNGQKVEHSSKYIRIQTVTSKPIAYTNKIETVAKRINGINEMKRNRNICNSIENQIMYLLWYGVIFEKRASAAQRVCVYVVCMGDNSLCRYENGFQFISSPFALCVSNDGN